jgi:hypothetical protein
MVPDHVQKDCRDVRQMTLVMAAAAFLAKLGADLRRSAGRKPNETSPNPPIAA